MAETPFNNLDIIHPYLLNGWQNYGGCFEDIEIFKNKDGLITMNGLVKGDFSKVIFKLPEGWKPKKQLIFSVMSDNTHRRLDINSNGEFFFKYKWSSKRRSNRKWLGFTKWNFFLCKILKKNIFDNRIMPKKENLIIKKVINVFLIK